VAVRRPIPVNEPKLDGRESEYLLKCITSGWISSEGPFVGDFERLFSSYVGGQYGTAVCNGTAALETALFALGIQSGDEIIMPSFTIISCAVAALRLGAKPVFVDINRETWNMDTSQVESKVTSKTKAIMPVHIFGHPVDMDPLFDIADAYKLKIIEDAAEAHGAQYLSKTNTHTWLKCGAMGDVACFSFYANKIITTGEGGMVVTNDPAIAKRAVSYRNLCFKPERRFYHTELCYNFRMTNLQAAVGLAQLERIEEFIAIKRSLGEYYRDKLSRVPGIRFQVEKPYAKCVYWMYAIEIDEATELTADLVLQRLGQYGIGARPFFMGLHAQPILQELGVTTGEHFPHTDKAYKQGLYLPSGLTLTRTQIDVVSEAMQEIMANN
jgi:perosamine synthetase